MDNVLFASYYWHLNISPDELRQRTWPQLNRFSFRVSFFCVKGNSEVSLSNGRIRTTKLKYRACNCNLITKRLQFNAF